MNKQNLGIYIRVSTQKQADKGLSADDQKERGIELAKKLGWSHKLYDDRGISATKISYKDRRLAELIQDCQDGILSGIFCVDIDRWSRDKNYEEGQVIITLIKATGVQVFTTTGEYKLDDPSTEFLMRLKTLFASFETQNRRNSIIRNLERSAKKGHAKGGAFLPYGYKKDENKLMFIDQEEAKIVRWIYKQAFDGKGKGCMVISRLLNEKGVLTKQGKMVKDGTYTGMIVRGKKQTEFKWRDKTVLGILQNPIYKGERKHRDITVPSPVIIEPTYWDAVQIKIQNRNQYKDTNNIYEYLLKGLIMCPNCGRKIQGKKRANGKDNCYTCMSYRHPGESCNNRGINIEYLNDLVCDNILSMDTLIEEALANKDVQAMIKKYKQLVKGYDEKITDLKKKQDKIIDAVADGTLSKDVVKKRMEVIEAELIGLENIRTIEERALSITKEKDALLKVAQDGIKEFRKMKTFNDRAGFVATAIRQITVRWIEEYRAYDIVILFRINNLENYLISKQVIVNRDGRDANRVTVNKVLSEYVTLRNFIQADETNGVLYYEPMVEYSDMAVRKKPPVKHKNGKLVW